MRHNNLSSCSTMLNSVVKILNQIYLSYHRILGGQAEPHPLCTSYLQSNNLLHLKGTVAFHR